MVWQLGKSDFKNRFASTSLGTIWGFLQPFVFMITYVIVFESILETRSSGDYPYAVWFIPAMAMWQTLNDMIMSASGSIRAYSYLVKKVVFPVDIIPNISIVASSFVGIFLFLVSVGVCIFFKRPVHSVRDTEKAACCVGSCQSSYDSGGYPKFFAHIVRLPLSIGVCDSKVSIRCSFINN